MNWKCETRCPREITAIDITDGSPTEIRYDAPLAKLDFDEAILDPNTRAIAINGQWFEASDGERLEREWQAAEHAKDSSFDRMLRKFLK